MRERALILTGVLGVRGMLIEHIILLLGGLGREKRRKEKGNL